MDDPKQLGHYEILGRIGEGGMGVVYRARDTRLGRTVALKVLPESYASDEERARRFEREARIVSGLSHPGIATLYDIDREGGVTFFAMELVEGQSLRQLLEQGPLPLSQVVACGLQVAEALAAAHRRGVVHRDLKPENVMAAESGYFKVLDFGVARLEQASAPESPTTRTPTKTWSTNAGTLLGTVAYMSPEQLLGKEVDARSDIFSLGVLLYELATGRQPFHGTNEIAAAHAVLSEQPKSLLDLRPELPQILDRIVQRCLAKKPEDRFPSTAELAESLRALQVRTLTGPRSGIGIALSDARSKRWAIAALVGLVGILAGLALLVPRPGPPGVSPGTALPDLRPGVVRAPLDPPPATAQAAQVAAARNTGRPRVIVAFFENATGDEEASWVSRGLPEMLTTDLSQAPELELIATQRLYDLLSAAGREKQDVLDRSTAAELARWAGADLVISGSVFKLGDTWRLDAQAYDIHTGAVTVAHKVEGVELLPMVNELSAALQQGLSRGGERQAPRRMLTGSEEAYRAYIDGKQAYDNLLYHEADQSLEQALRLDPGFGLAHLTLAMSRLRQDRQDSGLENLRLALEQEDALPEPQRLLARGLDAFLVGHDAERGDATMEELLARFPENQDARVWWAHVLAERDDGPMEAIQQLREAVAEDPNNVAATAALAQQMAELGAVEQARAMLHELEELNAEAGEGLARVMENLPDGP